MYVVTLAKQYRKWGPTQSRAVNKGLEYIQASALKNVRGRGWTTNVTKMYRGQKINGVYTIKRYITLRTTNSQNESSQWAEIYKYLVQAAQSQQGGKWTTIECPQDDSTWWSMLNMLEKTISALRIT